MKTLIQGRSLAILITVLLLPVTAQLLFTPSYQTNDDVVMRLLAEGNFVPGDEPLPYLMFINVIIGQLLSLAYSATTALPWYDLTLGASLIAASAALIQIWIGSGGRLDIVWVLILTAFFLLPTFVTVQFSLAGLACSAAGFGLITRAVTANLETKSRRRHLLIGTAMFVWGSLIRFPGAVLMAIEGMALAFSFAWGSLRNADERPRLRGALLAVCAALLLTGVGFGVSQLAYRQARGWKDFYEYNILRLRVVEYIAPERITPEATSRLTKEVGWSPNDFALFSNWFFADPNLFSLTRLRRVERLLYAESNKPTEGWLDARRERALSLGKTFFIENRWAFLLMGLFVIAHGMRPKLVLYFGGTVLTLGVLIVGIGLTLKAPPPRISWPTLILAMTMLTIAARRWGRPTHWSVNAAAILLGVYVVAAALPPLKQESDGRRLAAQVAQSEVESLRRTGATMFVLHANSFPYEDFWTPLHVKETPFDFVGLGVSARTPPVQDFLAKTGRTDLPRSLCTEPGMVIIGGPHVLSMITTFMREHHEMKVEFVQTFQGKRILAWKCNRVTGE